MAVIVGWITESVREIFQISELTLQSCLVFCTAFLLTCFFLKRRKNLPPYPAGCVPVLGHLLALGRAPHLKLTAWRRQYGDVFTVRMGMKDVVVLNGYTAVKDALVDRSELFASRLSSCLIEAMIGFGKDGEEAQSGNETEEAATTHNDDEPQRRHSRTCLLSASSAKYTVALAGNPGVGGKRSELISALTLKNSGFPV
ncbi:cytochrome P450 2 sub U member 1 [Branchiostoma belcheri]|nr:cytochrome P450 2 sub U member 1 [Branchiostoma belcheri]